MSTARRPISDYMTPSPVIVRPADTLAAARRAMNAANVRHLPVVENGRVVGILTERDLYVLTAFPEVAFDRATAAFAMTRAPFCVGSDTPLEDALATMARRRIGSIVVVDGLGRSLGIFTETDCVNVLRKTLKRRKKPAASAPNLGNETLEDTL